MGQWFVQLEGDEYSLRGLSRLFIASDWCVTLKEDEAYYLTSSDIDMLTDASEVYKIASDTLPRMNAILALLWNDAQPIKIQSVKPDSIAHGGFVFAAATMSASAGGWAEATVLGPDGKPIPSPLPAIAQRVLLLAKKDENVRDALRFFAIYAATGLYPWWNLFKVYEVIRNDIAGKKDIHHWATEEELHAFTDTANSYEKSGDQARHGPGRDGKTLYPALHPLSENEAVTFIKRLLTEWLKWKPL